MERPPLCCFHHHKHELVRTTNEPGGLTRLFLITAYGIGQRVSTSLHGQFTSLNRERTSDIGGVDRLPNTSSSNAIACHKLATNKQTITQSLKHNRSLNSCADQNERLRKRTASLHISFAHSLITRKFLRTTLICDIRYPNSGRGGEVTRSAHH